MALREIVALLGFEFDDKGLQQAQVSANGFVKNLRGIGAELMASGGVFAAVGALTHSIIDQGAKLDDQSQRLGISASELQELGYVAEQTGVDFDEFTGSLTKFTKAVVDAGTQGGGEFTKLGVKLKDANGKSRNTGDVFADAAQKISEMKDPTKQSAAAFELFGKSGLKMLPLLKQGNAGVKELRERFHDLGGGLDADVIENAAKADDALVDIKIATRSLSSALVASLLPAVAKVAYKVAGMMGKFRNWHRDTKFMKTAIAGVGAASVITGLKLGAKLAPKMGLVKFASEKAATSLMGQTRSLFALGRAGVNAIGPLIAMALIAEDLYVLFTGGNSAIGKLIDSIFGVGTANQVVATVKKTWADFIAYLNGPEGQSIINIAKEMIRGVFGVQDSVLSLKKTFYEFVEQVSKDLLKLTDNKFFDVIGKIPGLGGLASSAGKAIVGSLGESAAENVNSINAIQQGRAGTYSNVSGTVNQNNPVTINVNGSTSPKETANAVAASLQSQNNQNTAALGAVARP